MNKKSNDPESMAELFGKVKPARTDKLHLQAPPAAPQATFSRDDERAVLAESLDDERGRLESGDELVYRGSTVSPVLFRRLQRGRLAVQDEIDLHGLNAHDARQYLREFLSESQRRGLRCVRVVHGKGKRSGHRGPVLKCKVDGWLRRWSGVLAFCSARPADGGTGAVYVLLRKA